MKKKLCIALRYLFFLVFLTTAIGKLLDNRGFARVLSTYDLFPSPILLPLALAFSLGELYLGFLLAAGRRIRGVALVVLMVNTGYLTLALVTLYRGIAISNCGCFGVFLARPLGWSTAVEDGMIVTLSILYLFLTQQTFIEERQL